jgi:hypothetical protein
VYKVLVRKPKGKRHKEDLTIDGSIILKWILKKYDRRVWTDLAQARKQ